MNLIVLVRQLDIVLRNITPPVILSNSTSSEAQSTYQRSNPLGGLREYRLLYSATASSNVLLARSSLASQSCSAREMSSYMGWGPSKLVSTNPSARYRCLARGACVRGGLAFGRSAVAAGGGASVAKSSTASESWWNRRTKLVGSSKKSMTTSTLKRKGLSSFRERGSDMAERRNLWANGNLRGPFKFFQNKLHAK